MKHHQTRRQFLKMTGLGETAPNQMLWQFDAARRTIGFRPIKPGQQRPAFTLSYKEQSARCAGSVDVRLTMMGAQIDWKQSEKVEGKTRVPFQLSLPSSFQPPFGIAVQPADGVQVENAPRLSGNGYLFTGHVVQDGLPKGTKQIIVSLVDSTDAMAGGVIPAAGTVPFAGTLSGTWAGKVRFEWSKQDAKVNGGFTMTITDDGSVSGSFAGSDSGPITGKVSAKGKLRAGGGSAGAYSWQGTIRVDYKDGDLSKPIISGGGSWSGPDKGKGSWESR